MLRSGRCAFAVSLCNSQTLLDLVNGQSCSQHLMQTFEIFVCKMGRQLGRIQVWRRGAHSWDPVGIEREAVSGLGDALYDYGESMGYNSLNIISGSMLCTLILTHQKRKDVCMYLLVLPFIWQRDSREPVGLALGLVFSQIFHKLFTHGPKQTLYNTWPHDGLKILCALEPIGPRFKFYFYNV